MWKMSTGVHVLWLIMIYAFPNIQYNMYWSDPGSWPRGCPSVLPMVPPINFSSLPTYRQTGMIYRFHIPYSLIWLITEKDMHHWEVFVENLDFQTNGPRGYPRVIPMGPPVNFSSIPVCRHISRTCSLHMPYSLIWSFTYKAVHGYTAFVEFCHFCIGYHVRQALTPLQIWVSTPD